MFIFTFSFIINERAAVHLCSPLPHLYGTLHLHLSIIDHFHESGRMLQSVVSAESVDVCGLNNQ